MNFVKINKGKVELRNSWGILVRYITDRAKSCNISKDLILVTKLNGQVELRKDNGMLIRTIATGAEDAKFQGDSILVIKDRVCELRNQWGVLIRKV
jgi:hypothetical protein